MASPPPRTIGEILAAMRAGTLDAQSLMRRALAAIAAGAREAWISLQPAEALLAHAAALDARRAAEGDAVFETLPLFGLPFAVKDNIDVAGLPTTAACPGFASGPAHEHAAVVLRLVAAGAVPVGKTNLDQFATGLVGTRSPHGAVPNSIDPARVSGGSSSGSAYAVATGQVPFSLGTDTAGSGRVPAGFNHIVGLKPTRGWLPAHGVVPACRSLDCVSVFALTSEDAWTVATVAAGPDARDAYSRPALPPRLRSDAAAPLRVGVPDRLDFDDDTAAEGAFDAALAALRETQGIELVRVPFEPLARTASLLYQGPWVAERYAAVGAFLDRAPAGADPTVAAIVAGGRAPSAHALFAAQYELEALRREAEAMWSRIDVLVVPTAPTHPTIEALRADPIGPNTRLGRFTNFVNLLDMAAHAVPGPWRDDGLPAGITLIGPAFSDFALAQLGARWHRALAPSAGAMRQPLGPPPVLRAAPASRPLRLVAVGAHLDGLAFNWQFTERGARLIERTTTAPVYRLYSLTGATPTRPGLIHVGEAEGRAIEVEVWELDERHVGSFLALVAPPLALGTVELAGGRSERGFVCEPRAVAPGSGALDITAHGGWRGFLESRTAKA